MLKKLFAALLAMMLLLPMCARMLAPEVSVEDTARTWSCCDGQAYTENDVDAGWMDSRVHFQAVMR